jgi:hypothetical protein
LLDGVGTLVRFDESDRDVGPTLEAAPTLVQHGARLADTGCRTEVHPELPGRADSLVLSVTWDHVDLSSPWLAIPSVHSEDSRTQGKQ